MLLFIRISLHFHCMGISFSSCLCKGHLPLSAPSSHLANPKFSVCTFPCLSFMSWQRIYNSLTHSCFIFQNKPTDIQCNYAEHLCVSWKLVQGRPCFSYGCKWNYNWVCSVKHIWHFESKEHVGQLCAPHHGVHHLKVSLYFCFSIVTQSEPYQRAGWWLVFKNHHAGLQVILDEALCNLSHMSVLNSVMVLCHMLWWNQFTSSHCHHLSLHCGRSFDTK